MYEKKAPDSVIRIELITHFHRNPGIEGTPDQLADIIGRESGQVERQMEKLVQLRILEEKKVGSEIHYRYIPPFSISMSGMKNARGRETIVDIKGESKETANVEIR